MKLNEFVKKGVSEGQAPEIDSQATFHYAMKIVKALNDRFRGNHFDHKLNQDDSITIVKKSPWTDEVYRKSGRDLSDPDLRLPGALTAKNFNDAINPWYDSFREKGWRFDQPVGGSFGIAVYKQQGVAETKLDELSNELLARYKKAAGADARAADKRGDYKRGDKRFSGILKATDKEFKNALRGVKEDGNPDLPGAPPGIKIMTPQEFVSTAGNEVDEAISNRDRIAKGKPTGDEVRTKYYNTAMASMFGGKDTDEQKNKAIERYFKIMGITAPDLLDQDKKVIDKYYSNILASPDKFDQHKKRITALKGIADPTLTKEATTLPAPTRELKGKELEDYLDRIRGKEKKKSDKYKLPYIHRSDVVKYYNADGQKYDTDAIKAAISQRPAKLIKKNEKMRHSDGTYEQFFNVGFAALVGLALDESTGELVVVNTCPGAGSCKIDCFAMKGGKVQFAPAWMSDSRILTYLLNDPDGFFAQLKSEIEAQVKAGAKKDIKVSIRWHDAGDFFSPEYVDMAFKLARELPMVDFYAYTKVANVALGQKPANFMINWSEGAHPSQERKVKAGDPELETTKNSRIVPSKLFYDLLVKDEKKNLVKGPEGQWQVIPEKLPELKNRLASEYGLSKNSILSYGEWDSKVRGRDKSPLKYNVIIAPGEPDLTAKDPGVLSTLLLKH